MIIATNVLDMVTIITTTKNWMITSVLVIIAHTMTTTGKTDGGEMIYREDVQNDRRINKQRITPKGNR